MNVKSILSKIYMLLFDEESNNKVNSAYNFFMILSIIVSLIPLLFKQNYTAFKYIDYITVSVFIIDYILRWFTSNEKYKKGAMSFVIYPFSVMAIIDLLSILPSFTVVASGFRIFKVIRLIRSFKVFRALKIIRYSKNIEIILNVIKNQRNALITVGALAIGYIFISALVVFNVEPDSFNSFFDAVYWATISLTTVGYGDIYPVSDFGRVITMLSSLIGVAIVALPSGIITAGYMNEINKKDE